MSDLSRTAARDQSAVRVLLVEDDPADTRRIRDMLAESHTTRFEITQAVRVEDALRMLRDEGYDVVLLDLTLPEGEGLDALARAKVAAASVPIVVMTDEADPSLALRALRLGAQDYLTKGESDARFLVRALRHAVERHRMLVDLRIAREREHFLATHDSLTGLPNRFAFQDQLRRAVAFASRNGRHLAVLFLDLDRFKVINDSLGHAAGDELLKAAAGRLGDRVRDSDMVARLGGDEFVFMLQDIRREYAPARVAQEIHQRLSKPFQIHGREYWVTASTGIAIFPRDGTDPDTLLRNADTAMYHAKKQGSNRYHFYADGMNEAAAERLEVENGLREALERGQFQLHYQPQVDVGLKTLLGAEALLRWRHPRRGPTPPGEFIPVAEETDFIGEIGEWVLRTACQDASGWSGLAGRELHVAVNVSSRQLSQRGFVDLVTRVLRETDLEAKQLQIEITESSVMEERGVTLANLMGLRKLGVLVAIDDFGTGYSSLIALKRLPVDALKIDRAFVQDITSEPAEASMTTGLIQIARARGLQTIAEGVETEEQMRLLYAHGCHRMQGYLFAKPMPAVDFVTQLTGADRYWEERIPELQA